MKEQTNIIELCNQGNIYSMNQLKILIQKEQIKINHLKNDIEKSSDSKRLKKFHHRLGQHETFLEFLELRYQDQKMKGIDSDLHSELELKTFQNILKLGLTVSIPKNFLDKMFNSPDPEISEYYFTETDQSSMPLTDKENPLGLIPKMPDRGPKSSNT